MSGNSAISRLLMARSDDGTIRADGLLTPEDDEVLARIEELEAESGGEVSAEVVLSPGEESWRGTAREPVELEAAEFGRGLDSLWRRNSYSSIWAGAHEAWVASEPEAPGLLDDEPDEGEEGVVGEIGGGGEDAADALPSPWADLPGGRRFGTLVHSVMERMDFFAPDLEAELEAVVSAQLAYHRMDLDREAFVAALARMIETPLGPAAGGMRLRELMPKDRLDELTFELPLVGGDTPKGKLDVRSIGDLLAERLPAEDPLAIYARTLGEAEMGQAVRGYLTGSIDLALRVVDQELMAPKFFVVDYKTNWLGAPEEELTTRHYRPADVAAEMERGHYWLQALLYLVALHRYLRWRAPTYDPQLNLGGALYLFVRGMAGPDTPAAADGTPAGVVAWQPPADVIEALSALLDEGGGS
ncbi:MAG: PD-(D/E)XK nuclease family protein [Solirubrobacterales bacterium]